MTKPKKGASSKQILAREFANKRESMIREKELDGYLLREQLGMSPKGDMSKFVKEVVRKLQKRTRA